MSWYKVGKRRVFHVLNERLPLHFVIREDKWAFFEDKFILFERRDIQYRSRNFKFELKFKFLLARWISDGTSEKFNLVPILLLLDWDIPRDS